MAADFVADLTDGFGVGLRVGYIEARRLEIAATQTMSTSVDEDGIWGWEIIG
ncbi:MAG: hypothetical protein ACBR15_24840 [Microcoleus sp.]